MFAGALALSLQLASLVVAAPSLSVSVSSSHASVNSVNSLHVTATIINTGNEILRLLNDPSSVMGTSWETNSFRFVKNGSDAAPGFRGAMVKWSPTLAAEINAMTTIEPNQTVEFDHDLSTRYDFSNVGAGPFDIHAQDTFIHIDQAGNPVSLKAAVSTPASVTMGGSLNAVRTTVRSAKFAKRAKFNDCSAAQETDINNAVSAASSLATAAFNYLKSHTTTTPRYTNWFGTFDSGRHSTVTSNFQKVAGAHLSAFTYDCGCPHQDTFAFVTPSNFGEIFLCPAFFSAPLNGADSQAGTLVHELTHFSNIASTEDLEYGESACQNLARSNPAQAIENADNYEYFAENANPSLP